MPNPGLDPSQLPTNSGDPTSQNAPGVSSVSSAAQINDFIDYKDPFWSYASEIDGSRWNKSYPYQLLILDANVQSSPTSYNILDTFTLPIPPTDLSISTPFAISTQVTLGGIVEQHNAAPLRTMVFQGTTGVMPAMPSAASLPSMNLGQAIFAGSIMGATQAATSISTGVNGILNPGQNPRANVLLDSQVASDDTLSASSGYYQFRLLRQFIEGYVTIKKTKAGKSWRLAVAIWKDDEVYLVTPVAFDLKRNAGSPWEYNYSLQFKLWKRIRLDEAAQSYQDSPSSSTNSMTTLLAAVQNARNVLLGVSGLVSVVQGAIGDVTANILEPLRSLALLGLDATGVAISMAELPASIILDAKGAVLSAVSAGQSTVSAYGSAFNSGKIALDAENKAAFDTVAELAFLTQQAASGAANQAGLGSNPNAQTSSQSAHPGNSPFNNPTDSYGLFSCIDPGQLSLPLATQKAIVNERQRVRSLKKSDFATMQQNMIAAMASYSDAVGAGDPTYTATFNRQTVVTTRTPTDLDFDVMFAMNQAIMQLNRFVAYGSDQQTPPNPLDYVAGLATQAGIAFTTPVSKFSVPFPYGTTLEWLAERYLGDPNRWLEIAALNGLQEPYVDELGFQLPLLTNGRGYCVYVGDVSNLYVNQLIVLSANGAARVSAHITKITSVGTSYYQLTLDQGGLESFTTVGAAYLQAYLPFTVNSQMVLYIPSQTSVAEGQYDTSGIPGLDTFAPYFQIGGVDLLLTSSGDLAITPDGDCRFAVGLTSITQTIRLALSTPMGSLLHHPGYGIAITPGTSISDLSADQLLTAAKNLFRGDPTFAGVTSAAISLSGPVASMAIGVQLAGISQVIPVAVDVK